VGVAKQIREEKSSRRTSPAPRAGNGSNTPFVSFNPTGVEKGIIRDDPRPLGDVLDSLNSWVRRGHKLHIGFNDSKESFYAVLRQGGVDWKEAISLSCWHRDCERALRALEYGLSTKYRDFPAIQLAFFEDDLEW